MTPKILVFKIRELGRMSQFDVALSAGVNQSMLSKLERGVIDDIMSKSYVALMDLYVSLQAADKERLEFLSRIKAKKRKAAAAKKLSLNMAHARP